MLETKLFRQGKELHKVEATLVTCGKDLLLAIGGGEEYHIGAVALAVARPSLKNDGTTSASASVLCLTGHKEDSLAKKAAIELASMTGSNVTITIGLHINSATCSDIAKLEDNFWLLLQKIEKYLLKEK